MRSSAPGAPGCSTAPDPEAPRQRDSLRIDVERQHPRTHQLRDERRRRPDESLSNDDHGLRRAVPAEMQRLTDHEHRYEMPASRRPSPDGDAMEPVDRGHHVRLVTRREHDAITGRDRSDARPDGIHDAAAHVQQLFVDAGSVAGPRPGPVDVDVAARADRRVRDPDARLDPAPAPARARATTPTVRGAVRYQWSISAGGTLNTHARDRPR